jgi:hypothetical protein
MPNRQTRVETNASSGEIKVTVPSQPAGAPPTATQTTVEPGTSEHDISVLDVAQPEPGADMPERRRNSGGVQVQVQQPQAGGLTGPWATAANLTGVGIIFVLVFLFYRDSQSDKREMFNQMREERRQDRSDQQAATAAMVAALNNLTMSTTATTASNTAMVAEMRETRREVSALVKAIAKDKGIPMPPDPMGAAPAPRLKGDGG